MNTVSSVCPLNDTDFFVKTRSPGRQLQLYSCLPKSISHIFFFNTVLHRRYHYNIVYQLTIQVLVTVIIISFKKLRRGFQARIIIQNVNIIFLSVTIVGMSLNFVKLNTKCISHTECISKR